MPTKKEKKDELAEGIRSQSVPIRQIIKPVRTARTQNVDTLRAVIRKHRTVSPILVKPDGKGHYEIIWGERRYWACKDEGFTFIPAQVREDIDDLTLQSLRIIENEERVDLPLLEQAQQIHSLLELGQTPEVIADSLGGRSVSWVLRRATLMRLSDRWKDLVVTGIATMPESDEYDETQTLNFSEWSLAHYAVIARFETPVQDAILDSLVGDFFRVTEDMSAQGLIRHIERFQCQLSVAVWDTDEDGIAGIGPCSACKKRLLFQPSLFEDIEELQQDDQCLDRLCWQKKHEAYVTGKKAALDEQYPNLIVRHALMQGDAHDLPEDSTLLAGAHDPWDLNEVTPETEGAIPVMTIDGPEAGELSWRVPNTMTPSGPRLNEDGTRKPSTLAQRKQRLEKRRTTKYIITLQENLQGEIKEPNKFLSEHITEEMIVAAAATFGLNPTIKNEWDTFEEYRTAYGAGARERAVVLLELLNGVAHEWLKGLDAQLRRDVRDRSYLDNILTFIGMDPDKNWADLVTLIPDPKSWDKLNKDGTPKTKEVKKDK